MQHAQPVDHAVGQFCGDDFLAQPVSQNSRLMRFDHRVRECRQKLTVHRPVLRQRCFLNPILRCQLRCGEQNRQFRPREPAPFAGAPEQFLIGCQPFNHTVQSASTFKNLDKPYIGWQIAGAAGFCNRQGERLQTVIFQHQMRHGVGHLREQDVAGSFLQLACAHLRIQGNFDVHFIVGTINARAIVDEVCIDPTSAQGKANASSLRHAKVRALANDLGLHICAVDTNEIITGIADVQMAFAPVLYIGPYATEPHQLNRRFQYRGHQCRWFNFICIDAEQIPDFICCFDDFIRAGKHAAALGN